MEIYKCPEIDCEESYDKLISLSLHFRRIHKKTAKDLRIILFHNGIEPTCKCGCGGPVKFLSVEEGFREYQRGHIARIVNNWGHNAEAQRKSKETKQKMWDNGELSPWNKGLTAETNESVALNTKRTLEWKERHPEQKEKESERMKQLWKDGKITPLQGEFSPRWKGGISSLNATVHSNRRFYLEWKFPILKSHNFTCQDCQASSYDSNVVLHVHHTNESFSEILHKVAKEMGWTECVSNQLIDSEKSKKLFLLKQEIAEKVVDYHVQNKVEGKVLCRACHGKLHPTLNTH